MTLDARALEKDVEWFVQGVAAKFGVPVTSVEMTITIHDDDQGESTSVGWKKRA